MGAGFINGFARNCGGSRVLAWLLTSLAAAGVLIWASTLILRWLDIPTNFLYTYLALPGDPLSFATHPWTLLTYMCVHFSPLHLLFNLLWLYWFGRMLSDVEYDSTVLRLLLGGGLTGGVLYILGSALSGIGPGNYLTGVSAAVLSVMCATALRMPDRTITLFLLGEVKVKWIALVCVLLTLAGSGGNFPALLAHMGGVAFAFAWFFARRRLRGFSRNRSRTVRPAFNPTAASKAIRKAVPDTEALHIRLDELLDKVRQSGYDSLTSKEKAELNHISSRIEA